MARSSNLHDSAVDDHPGTYELSNEGAISERVVAAVAATRDVDPLDLPALYEVIDPDALNTLFEADRGVAGRSPARVSFTLAGCDVVVHGSGQVDVTEPDEQPAARSPECAPGSTEPETELE